jgi:hypothetical protein
MSVLQNLPQIVTAVGGLGTAAFGLVDAIKPLGVNHIGFPRISTAVKGLTPGSPAGAQPSAPAAGGQAAAGSAETASPAPAANALSQAQVVASLKANWYNGTDLGSQKSIAKSLIKMGLNEANAAPLAAVTGVDGAVLKSVAQKITKGTKLEPDESDIFARFDFSLTALLDEVYQHADQVYRNWTRILAAIIAVILALVGGWTLHVNQGVAGCYWGWSSSDMWIAFLAGVLATPLAPIAKDVSNALSTAVNTMQAIKK